MNLNINTDELKKFSLFIGAPCYGGNTTGLFTKSTNELSAMCAAHGIPLRFYYLFNESLVQRARNYIVDEFLRSDATHFMFIDADIGFNARDVLSLLAIQVTYPEKYDILVGAYPKKTIAWEKVKQAVLQGKADNPFDLMQYAADYVFNISPGVTQFRLDEPVELTEAGTGFMLIPRYVFEKYEKAYPQYHYIPDHVRTENFDGSREIMAYFDCEIDPISRRYLSEDYFFCRNSRAAGMKVHMCPWMDLMHTGSYTYRGSLSMMASLGVSPTATQDSSEKSYKQKEQPINQTKPPKKNISSMKP